MFKKTILHTHINFKVSLATSPYVRKSQLYTYLCFKKIRYSYNLQGFTAFFFQPETTVVVHELSAEIFFSEHTKSLSKQLVVQPTPNDIYYLLTNPTDSHHYSKSRKPKMKFM